MSVPPTGAWLTRPSGSTRQGWVKGQHLRSRPGLLGAHSDPEVPVMAPVTTGFLETDCLFPGTCSGLSWLLLATQAQLGLWAPRRMLEPKSWSCWASAPTSPGQGFHTQSQSPKYVTWPFLYPCPFLAQPASCALWREIRRSLGIVCN